MLAGVNDTPDLARELADYLRDIPGVHVNLIPYNATDAELRPTAPRAIGRFRTVLHGRGVNATVRVTRGAQIEGACGQLAGRK
jgi:23S rRNA (adenine2503-C2)-methyltransferase